LDGIVIGACFGYGGFDGGEVMFGFYFLESGGFVGEVGYFEKRVRTGHYVSFFRALVFGAGL
jgi:hypothetical protein